MSAQIDEVMNHELFCVHPDESVSETLRIFSYLAIAAAPVVDGAGRPVGFVSLRDIAQHHGDTKVADCMTSPADVISRDATIDEAARAMAERNRHHLVVVDHDDRVVGYVGSLDIVRGLLDMPAKHPDTFPHYDSVSGLSWTDEFPLDSAHVEEAPDGPGLLRLVQPREGERDRVVWAEGTHNVRTRVLDILSTPQPRLAAIADEIAIGGLRFRAASTTRKDTLTAMAKAVGLQRLQERQ